MINLNNNLMVKKIKMKKLKLKKINLENSSLTKINNSREIINFNQLKINSIHLIL